MRNCLPHVVFDLEKPTEMFLAEVEELLQNAPGYEDIVTDQEEFDANQNLMDAANREAFLAEVAGPSEVP